MKTDDFELHNIAELDADAGYTGMLVRRWPRDVANQLELGALVSTFATLCELRFVVESGRRLVVVLTSVEGGDLFVYRGDFIADHIRIPSGTQYRLLLDFADNPFGKYDQQAFSGGRFSPAVWRVVFDGPTLLHGIDRMGCRIRPPRADEKPAIRWLAYGSSITHGYTPFTRMQCYVAQAARHLGVDAINLGLSGACHCEAVAADYLAARTDWDIITCEVGVNMRGSVNPDEFAARVRYLADVLTSRHPNKPVVLISPFGSNSEWVLEPDVGSLNTAGYRLALDAIATEMSDRKLHVIDGRELLPGLSGLRVDMVHPDDDGHARIGENLAMRLRSILDPNALLGNVVVGQE